MEDLKLFFQGVMTVMQTEMTLYGLTFSWWDIFIWSALALVVGSLLWRFFE